MNIVRCPECFQDCEKDKMERIPDEKGGYEICRACWDAVQDQVDSFINWGQEQKSHVA